MTLAIVIPTYNRIEKLNNCIRSILNQDFKNYKIYVYCDDNDLSTFRHIQDHYKDTVFSVLNSKPLFVAGSWNRFTSENFESGDWDAMARIVDDVVLYSDCLSKTMSLFEKSYTDTDGVTGIAQVCPGNPNYTYKPFGQCVIGRKFIERFKTVNYKVCCPAYNHWFHSEEMYNYACSVGKFNFCKDAVLEHHHPAFIKNLHDQTHDKCRGPVRKNDEDTWKRRQSTNLMWGLNFTL
jgi:glycosyltransferase involved in cell wall biosynthesis